MTLILEKVGVSVGGCKYKLEGPGNRIKSEELVWTETPKDALREGVGGTTIAPAVHPFVLF